MTFYRAYIKGCWDLSIEADTREFGLGFALAVPGSLLSWSMSVYLGPFKLEVDRWRKDVLDVYEEAFKDQD